ncbi:cytochrome P450 [Pseudomassariella vexata]|uniref:Cytochrome P450 n=1 Tax=Pseudomassariella vexata TaxID=1141098 RepID=A0A1Y2DNU4_9PEZI|nr:cytochrome P450 [Pseudomassariella vexata]ORY60834.1 cytochrome P450 [Pseudomassariella vexata]
MELLQKGLAGVSDKTVRLLDTTAVELNRLIFVFIFISITSFLLRKILIRLSDADFMRRTGSSRGIYYLNQGVFGFTFWKSLQNAGRAGKLTQELQSRFAKVGPTFIATGFDFDVVHTADRENLTWLLNDINNFGKGPKAGRRRWGSFIKGGGFVTDDKEWEKSRDMAKEALDNRSMMRLDRLDKQIEHLPARLPRDGHTLEYHNTVMELVHEIVMELLIGIGQDEDFSAQVNALRDDVESGADVVFWRRMRKPSIQRYFFFWQEFPEQCRLECAAKHIHAVIDYYLQEVVAKREQKAQEMTLHKWEKGEDMSMFVYVDRLLGITNDLEAARCEVVTLIGAGTDGVISLLSHLLYQLSHRPELFKKLQAEIDTLGGEKPDEAMVNSLKYLHGVICESS